MPRSCSWRWGGGPGRGSFGGWDGSEGLDLAGPVAVREDYLTLLLLNHYMPS
jgi:hypothetical protein